LTGSTGDGATGGAGDWRLWQGGGPALVDSQLDALHATIQEHALGRDVCLLSGRGVGKTTLARRFASLLDYGQPHSVFCHQVRRQHCIPPLAAVVRLVLLYTHTHI